MRENCAAHVPDYPAVMMRSSCRDRQAGTRGDGYSPEDKSNMAYFWLQQNRNMPSCVKHRSAAVPTLPTPGPPDTAHSCCPHSHVLLCCAGRCS
jgi:hypothetical protein